MKLLTDNTIKVGSVDADRPEFGDRVEIPDTEALAERVRACLQEGEELPVDFTELFDHSLFKYDVSMIPEAVRLYDKLGVKHEPLSLIPPQFEVPLPPLQPAVFMPTMRELPPPGLDLYDLDEEFSRFVCFSNLPLLCSYIAHQPLLFYMPQPSLHKSSMHVYQQHPPPGAAHK